MNIKNNKRRRESIKQIESAFIECLQTKELSEIRVSELCEKADINRSTFYANFIDIYDLADKIKENLEKEVNELFGEDAMMKCGCNYMTLFSHIKENQIFYKTYFKLGYADNHLVDIDAISRRLKDISNEELQYRVEFHKAGLNAIIKKWLKSGCKESPETIVQIIKNEYSGREII